MPVILGPATVLLIGVLGSLGHSADVIYSSIMVGGAVLAILAATGVFSYLRPLFTPRVVAVILLLVAFTMTPTIMGLITAREGGVSPLVNLLFSMALILAVLAAHRRLTGVWKSSLIIWALIGGSIFYFLVNPHWAAKPNGAVVASYFTGLSHFSLDAGVVIAFLLCFLALSINDLGSIQSVGGLLKPDDMPRRITRGITVTGLGNVLSGYLGVIGPVNFSFSPGVIVSTGCASRFVLAPLACGLLVLSFSPLALGILSNVPRAVTGCMLLYIMCTQMATGLTMAFDALGEDRFDNAIVIGLPLLLGVMVAFLPTSVVNTIPAVVRPILGNGFIMGVLVCFILEHLVFRKHR
jgi:xanthine/uracil permease